MNRLKKLSAGSCAELLPWLACSLVGAACGDSGPVERTTHELEPYFVSASSAQDTTLLEPYRVYAWSPRLVVLDIMGMRVVAFDTLGRRLWTQGRAGDGPGEYRGPSAAAIAPNGNLWVLDPNSTRVTELSPDGSVVTEISVRDAPILATDVASFGDSVVVVAPRGRDNLLRARGWRLEGSVIESLPAPDSAPERSHFVVSMASDPDGRFWVAAHKYGPGFVVGTKRGMRFHPFVEPVPWETGGMPALIGEDGKLLRAASPMADTRSYGAHQVAVAGGRIYMLFGGRPGAATHGAQLPTLIDVYEPSGSYVESYRLPFGATGFTTDGSNFFVIREDPTPALIGLRPKR